MLMCSDEMVECPYNKSHVMLRKRLQSHLLKCRLHYPDIELRKCVFNGTHLVMEHEFERHVTTCPDRNIMTQYKHNAPEDDESVSHAPVQSDENWDETDVPDYDPTKYTETAPIIRKPEGPTPSQRKDFIKKERKRLGDDSDDDDSRQSLHSIGPNVEENRTSSGSRHTRSSRSRSPHERSSPATRFSNTEKRRRQRSPPTPPTPPPPIYSASSLRERDCYDLDEDPYYNNSTSRASSSIYQSKKKKQKNKRSRSHSRDSRSRSDYGSSRN